MTVLKPPMGWNSWNTFGNDISEKLIMETTDIIADGVLKKAGYEYIVIDDCWSMRDRDAEGRLVADPEKFPHGMKYVADYVHSKGLKFGMYSCSGNLTCAGYPGSFEHEYIDAATFAEWGVDFLKYDYCYHSNKVPPEDLYRRIGLALANSGRDILLSACSWGCDGTNEWIKSTGSQMWRSTGDIFDKWDSIRDLIKQQHNLFTTNGQGCFNDMDMLVVGMNGKGNVGVGGCSYVEYRTHFAVWCLFGSPLMIGCDIRDMDEQTTALLTDPDLLAIDGDSAYRQVFYITPMGWAEDHPIYARYLDNGDIAIGMLNLGDSEVNIAFTTEDLGIPAASGKTVELFDLFSKQTMTDKYTSPESPVNFFNSTITARIAPHDCAMLRAKVVSK